MHVELHGTHVHCCYRPRHRELQLQSAGGCCHSGSTCLGGHARHKRGWQAWRTPCAVTRMPAHAPHNPRRLRTSSSACRLALHIPPRRTVQLPACTCGASALLQPKSALNEHAYGTVSDTYLPLFTRRPLLQVCDMSVTLRRANLQHVAVVLKVQRRRLMRVLVKEVEARAMASAAGPTDDDEASWRQSMMERRKKVRKYVCLASSGYSLAGRLRIWRWGAGSARTVAAGELCKADPGRRISTAAGPS